MGLSFGLKLDNFPPPEKLLQGEELEKREEGAGK
jgi:hypothetical protein